MKALIAGGGIGGLTTALFLHKAGIEVEVFERAEDIRELGVGINMLPHAVKELAGIGLLGDLDARGIRTHELIYANRECRERCNRVFQSGRRLCPLPGVGKVDLNGRNGAQSCRLRRGLRKSASGHARPRGRLDNSFKRGPNAIQTGSEPDIG
jgi:hypothetical protein